MKSKKKPKTATILSPENYIRQKSRNLSIYKCYIPEGWEESKLCYIIITRRHVSGNVTFCMYLVDLGCLGVKDTIYHYNVPIEAIDDLLKKMKDEGSCFEEVPYELAHNIIHAGIDYAKEYGFEPCRDFLSITSHFLEEDTDDIPYIDIDCGGIFGNPIYVNTGFESSAREKQILAQLEKTAGEGNFNIDEDLYEDDETGYTEEEKAEIKEKMKIVEELKILNLEEKKKLFLELLPKDEKPDSITDDNGTRLILLCSLIAYEIINEEELDRQIKQYREKFDMIFDDIEDLPNSLFEGVSSLIDHEKLIDLFDNTMQSIIDNDHPKKAIAKFRKEVGDVPVTCFMELSLYDSKKGKSYDKTLKTYCQKYPDYFLFKANYFTHFMIDGNKNFLSEFEDILLNHGQTITNYEADLFFYNYGCLLGIAENYGLATIMAYEVFIRECDWISDSVHSRLFSILSLLKIQRVYDNIITDVSTISNP